MIGKTPTEDEALRLDWIELPKPRSVGADFGGRKRLNNPWLVVCRTISSKQYSPGGATAQMAYTGHRPTRSSPKAVGGDRVAPFQFRPGQRAVIPLAVAVAKREAVFRGSKPIEKSPCFMRTPPWNLHFTFRHESTYTGLGCESTMLDPTPTCPRNKHRQNNRESCQARKRSCRYVICSPVAYWRGLRSTQGHVTC